MVDQKREARRIPVRQISSEEMWAELDIKIESSERHYKQSSEQMLQSITCGAVEETAEILEWMQAYHVRRWLTEKTTPTTGTHSTITEQSMKIA